MAAPPNAAEVYGHEILPILENKCLGCHGQNLKTMGGLDLTSFATVVRGGESGSVIEVGRSQDSLLVQQIISEQMPPSGEGEPLSAEELHAIVNWIDHASFPSFDGLKKMSASPTAKDHWAFQPRSAEIKVPATDNQDWSQNPIDQFIYKELCKKDIEPVKLADQETLLRRITYDLTGLPPTIAEQDAYLQDVEVDPESAYARLIDRLLASQAYAERWGRHWLDVARYADTSGCLADYPIPWMYRYRDWVIKAFHRDLPYDEFIRWQLAGDILARSATDAETYADQNIATGFIAASRRFGLKIHENQHLTIEDTIDTLGRGVMGLTMRCARCHDHKFDPIPTEDYYAIYGIFASTRYPFCGSSEYKTPEYLVSVSFDPQQRLEELERMNQASRYTLQLRSSPDLTKVKKAYDALSAELKQARLEDKDTAGIQDKMEQLRDKHPRLHEWFEEGTAGVTKLRASFIQRHGDPAPAMAYAVSEDIPRDANLQRRGDPKLLGPVIPRGALSMIRNLPSFEIHEGSGRRELADWLTHPAHPLTARVIVNRIWQWHFGRGIVSTSDSFGVMGASPSHPELLDWLANKFVADGWSIKNLHRQILHSRVYRLASDDNLEARNKDGDNVLLWQFRPRRLEAEALRDAMMMIAGTLNQTPDTQPHPFPKWWEGKAYNLNYPFDAAEYTSDHRSVYLMTQRFFSHPYLGLFNGPNTSQTTTLRDRADNSTQVLYWLNSAFSETQARSFTDRIFEDRDSDDDRSRIQLAYRMAYGRRPTLAELELAESFLLEAAKLMDASESEHRPWNALAKSLLMSNEFVYLY